MRQCELCIETGNCVCLTFFNEEWNERSEDNNI